MTSVRDRDLIGQQKNSLDVRASLEIDIKFEYNSVSPCLILGGSGQHYPINCVIFMFVPHGFFFQTFLDNFAERIMLISITRHYTNIEICAVIQHKFISVDKTQLVTKPYFSTPSSLVRLYSVYIQYLSHGLCAESITRLFYVHERHESHIFVSLIFRKLLLLSELRNIFLHLRKIHIRAL